MPYADREAWGTLAEPVAIALLGEPSRRSQTELRFGRRGSVCVRLDSGTWYDHEAGEGGGMLDLVTRERQCDRRSAVVWLKAAGLLRDGPNGDTRKRKPQRHPASLVHTKQRKIAIDGNVHLAARLWNSAKPADGTPASGYLASRGAWPPDRPLPDSVRWLAGAAADGLRLPPRTAGVMTCAWRTPSAAATLLAVSMEALTAEGQRTEPRWRQSRGTRSGCVFRVLGDPAGPIHCCEGEVDALTIRTWQGAEAWAAGGSGGMRSLAPALAAAGRTIVLDVDGDAAGGRAAADLRGALVATGVDVRIAWSEPGSDPADDLVAHWSERAAIQENDGCLSRAAAETAAWREMAAEMPRTGEDSK